MEESTVYRQIPPTTLLSPAPVVLVSCAEAARPENRNLITIAWTGTVNTKPPMVSVSVKPSRYSYGMIADSGEFVVNLVDENLCRAADYCGVRSGRDVNKAEEMNLRWRPAEGMRAAPALEGAPVSLSCRVRKHTELGSHTMFIGEVVAASVREDLMDEEGGIRLERAGLVAYNHGLYQRLGETLGFFGYAVSRPEVYARRMEQAGARPVFELKSARYQAAEILRAALRPGDRVIDATMGNGHDTAMLCSLVGPEGHVDAFDIQPAALKATEERLARLGFSARAALHQAGHQEISQYVTAPVKAAVFNLGWLPGGDHTVTTRTETTLSAVRQAAELLLPMGVLVICVYPGHLEGRREKAALEQWLASLPPRRFNVLAQSFLNAGPDAPVCYTAQRQPHS